MASVYFPHVKDVEKVNFSGRYFAVNDRSTEPKPSESNPASLHHPV